MPKHTPSPWTVNIDNQLGVFVSPIDCCLAMVDEMDNEEVLANARLIAASPDLLSVCREVVH